MSIAFVLAGCGAKIQEARFNPAPARTAPEHVAVFQATRPECHFDEVGTLTVEKRNAFVSSQEMLGALRERAARMGGDAIVGLSEGNRVRGAVAMGNVIGVANRQTFSATVIRFSSLECRKE
jgi:hypothetical protein